MKIYTRKGDTGTTQLLGGARVPKHHLRIEAYGTVDELNSHIGLLRDQGVAGGYGEILLAIQDRLFVIGGLLALEPGHQFNLPRLLNDDVAILEREIDHMEEGLPEMKNFVLPGGNISVSYAHIARCVCRRAERNVTHLSEVEEVDPLIVQYLNRLSDYLFVLSRKWSHQLGVDEIPWKPRG